MRLSSTLMASALAGLLAVQPAIAGDKKMEKTKASQQQKTARIEGEVIDVTEAKIKGKDEKHTLAKVRLKTKKDQEKTVVLDFGPASRLLKEGAKIEKGARVRVKGREGTINKRPVLMVYAFDLAPKEMQQQKQQKQQKISQLKRTGDLRLVQGKIKEMKNAKIKGLSSEQQLVKVESERGQTVVANLGNPADLKDLDLEAGDSIMLKGVRGSINGKEVLFTTQVAKVQQVRSQK